MENRILKVGAGKTHLKSLDQENTDKTTRKITEKIIEEYIKTKNYKIIDKHGGIIRYSRGLKDKFYHNKVVAVGDAVSAINPRGGEGIRYAMQSAELASKYIEDYLKTGKENFKEYKSIWRNKKLLKWKLSEFSGRRMYSQYTDNQVENRVKFFYKNFTIDDMIASLFNFKYNKLFTRAFQYSLLKLSYLFKKEKF
jgi:flavin-dependent dehydrogenase